MSETQDDGPYFPVVGIGGSAGGLNAFERVFDLLDPDTGAAFVVIQHLKADQPSQLVEILARHTAMPVLAGTDGATVEPNHVYVATPGRELELADGRLRLIEPEPPHHPPAAIDRFFRSLAFARGARAIGVVFSGMGDDGTLGLKAIKAGGGVVLVQDPATAAFDAMPRSAAATHMADRVLDVDGIAGALHSYLRHHAREAPQLNEDHLTQVLELLRRYLTRTDHHYQVNDELRQTIVFAVQDLLHDPPYSRLDLISCRNVLIYLGPETQKYLLTLFHFALRDGGYLFLGNAENIGQADDLFEPVDPRYRIYRRLAGIAREHRQFPFPSRNAGQYAVRQTQPPTQARVSEADQVAQKLLLREYVPAAVLINRKAEILCAYGPTQHYLALPTGASRLDLMDMAADDLRNKLRTAVHRAIRDNSRSQVTALREHSDRAPRVAHISVRPLLRPASARGLFLVTFSRNRRYSRPRRLPTARKPPWKSVLPKNCAPPRRNCRAPFNRWKPPTKIYRAPTKKLCP